MGQIIYLQYFLSYLNCTVSFISPVFCSLLFLLIFSLFSFYFRGLAVCDTCHGKYPFQVCFWHTFKHCPLWIFNECCFLISVSSFCIFICLFCFEFVLLHFCILGKLETLSIFLFFFFFNSMYLMLVSFPTGNKSVLMPTKVSELDSSNAHCFLVLEKHFQISRSSDFQCSSCFSNYF